MPLQDFDPLFQTMGAGISAGATYLGQRQANRANIQMAREQMDFQKNMYSARYQTMVEDLRKAGLNPALAYSQGPGGSPGGAMAQVQDELGKGVSSAMEFRRFMQELKYLKAQTKVAETQASLNANNATKAEGTLQYWLGKASDYINNKLGSVGNNKPNWDFKLNDGTALKLGNEPYFRKFKGS